MKNVLKLTGATVPTRAAARSPRCSRRRGAEGIAATRYGRGPTAIDTVL